MFYQCIGGPYKDRLLDEWEAQEHGYLIYRKWYANHEGVEAVLVHHSLLKQYEELKQGVPKRKRKPRKKVEKQETPVELDINLERII
jgi:hypothetical protein